MAVLLLVGQKNEQPSIITKLLDVGSNPCKPQYTPAIGLPLNLFHCEFRSHSTRQSNLPAADDEIANLSQIAIVESESESQSDLTNWVYSEENLQKLIENVQSEWTQFSVKCTMIRNVLVQLEALLEQNFKTPQIQAQAMLLQDAAKPRQYQPLLQRKRCG